MSGATKPVKISHSQFFNTRNNIPDNIKLNAINILNQLVIDLIDLALITKQAHWNLRGSEFIAIHEMLDTFRTSLLEHQDTLAERVVQLGGVALGTSQEISRHSSVKPYPTDIYHITDHLTALADRYATVANYIREKAPIVEDENVVDMLVAASRDLDKFLWFIEAHLEK